MTARRLRKRRTRSTSDSEQKPILASQQLTIEDALNAEEGQSISTSTSSIESIEPEPTSANKIGEAKSILTLQIDQIRAELLEEEYLNPTESEYSNETHSWGDKLPESDDYWHFVSRYE